jgi:hypothetical protein
MTLQTRIIVDRLQFWSIEIIRQKRDRSELSLRHERQQRLVAVEQFKSAQEAAKEVRL